jgi:phenylacetate-CoA ligase
VLDQYGSREVLEIAIEDDNYVMHSSDDFVIVELGKENEIILTPLESYGMPLLRYVIGDVGMRKNYKKQDNHPFNQFNILIGRSCEVMRNAKGEKVSSSRINLQIAKEKLNIGEFQLVQKSLKEVDLNIVKSEETSENDVKRLSDIVKFILRPSKIKINYLKRFPLEKSGKKIGYKCLIDKDDLK